MKSASICAGASDLTGLGVYSTFSASIDISLTGAKHPVRVRREGLRHHDLAVIFLNGALKGLLDQTPILVLGEQRGKARFSLRNRVGNHARHIGARDETQEINAIARNVAVAGKCEHRNMGALCDGSDGRNFIGE